MIEAFCVLLKILKYFNVLSNIGICELRLRFWEGQEVIKNLYTIEIKCYCSIFYQKYLFDLTLVNKCSNDMVY